MELQKAIEKTNRLGSSRTPFFLMADFELKKIQVIALSDLGSDILYDINGFSNHSFYQNIELDLALKVEPYPFDKYYQAFDQVMDEILYGNTFLINLTAKHKVLTQASLLDIFNQAKAKYKLMVDGQYVVFSPESFVSIKSGKISSFPMKGTIDASLPKAKEILLNDKKETAEHYTIVDLIRNDLSMHAKQVAVDKFRYLDLIKSNHKDLYQMSSAITGQLPEDYQNNLGDILFSMLPAGSVSGAPKKKTTEIISAVESEPRGYYTGICGIYDGKDFDSFVMIRFIEKDEEQLYYRSGGGITFQSQVEQEYQEMINKIYIPIS